MDETKLIFTDDQYDIHTAIEANGFEHAKNLMEISFASLNDFRQTGGLSKEEATQRVDQMRTKFEELYKEFIQLL